MKKTLEQLCSFAETCVESNYGNEEVCVNDYSDCKIFNNKLKDEIENYSVPKLIDKVLKK